MFFSAFYGNDNSVSSWRNAVYDHSEWLGLTHHIEERKLQDNKIFAFAWLKSSQQIQFNETNDYILLNTDCQNIPDNGIQRTPWQRFSENIDKNTVQLGYLYNAGEIRVLMPLTSPDTFYFSEESGNWLLGNDLRLFLRLREMELDENAVYGFLKYHIIPAPLTISKNIKRIPNGYSLKIIPELSKAVLEVSDEIINYTFSNITETKLPPKTLVRDTLDTILSQMPESSILLYSGGVDSALLASRLLEMGRSDIKFYNYSAGVRGDPCDDLAAKTAKCLGISFKQIKLDLSNVDSLLNNLFKNYSHIFCDPALIPSNIMIQSLSKLSPSAIIDGTGADCVFAGNVYSKYKFGYRIPFHIRNLLGGLYNTLDMWRYSTKISKPFSFMKKTSEMSMQTYLFGNSFQHTLYHMPDNIADSLEENLNNYAQSFFKDFNKPDQEDCSYNSILSLAYNAANQSVAKTYDLLRTKDTMLFCPFLDPQLLKAGFSLSWEEKCYHGEAKSILKNLLTDKLPPELIYCKKRNFNAPSQKILSNEAVSDFINDTILNKNNPLTEFINLDRLKYMLNKNNHKHMRADLFLFLWTFLFLSAWLHQFKAESKPTYTACIHPKELII